MTDQLNLLLADDDFDDCILFYEALSDLSLTFTLTTVHDGFELIRQLTGKDGMIPHILFLDLNMPLKNGIECLAEIRRIENLKRLPVIIYSTSYQPEVVSSLYDIGATFYIRKPSDYAQLKKVISHTLTFFNEKAPVQPSLENFVLFD
jgi:CheY-like chemotaxis protein